jgi:pyoverdine/dityrosine biosynthesis protein Dit1/AcrR family transcriptional regulator
MESIVQRQDRADRSHLRILEAALGTLRTTGWDSLGMKEVAERAGVSVGLVCRNFPTRDHFAFALYDRLAEELQSRVSELPEGSVVDRFFHVMNWKLALLEPHRDTLTALAGVAIDPRARAGVLGAATESVRAKVAGVFELVVAGASDAPADPSATARLLYAAHLLMVLAWVQLTPGASLPLPMWQAMAASLGPMLPSVAAATGPMLTQLFGGIAPSADGRAAALLRPLLRRLRLDDGAPTSVEGPLVALHGLRVQSFIERGAPLQLVLPAFPAKSPNPRKVLGKRPDLAEWLALKSLGDLLEEIRAVHPPGAELVLCSDGGVFADLVGVSDSDVREYRRALEGLVVGLGLTRVRVFDLDDAFGAGSAPRARAALLERYGGPLEELRERCATVPASQRMVDGIHRFLFEDEVGREVPGTRSQLKRITRDRAHEVVLRSEAWGRLVSAAFPRALRLSIHPQPAVSAKLGIHLLDTDDAWLTPWHGCAVLEAERFTLMRRADAEARGAVRRTSEDGLPYLEIVR